MTGVQTFSSPLDAASVPGTYWKGEYHRHGWDPRPDYPIRRVKSQKTSDVVVVCPYHVLLLFLAPSEVHPGIYKVNSHEPIFSKRPISPIISHKTSSSSQAVVNMTSRIIVWVWHSMREPHSTFPTARKLLKSSGYMATQDAPSSSWDSKWTRSFSSTRGLLGRPKPKNPNTTFPRQTRRKGNT